LVNVVLREIAVDRGIWESRQLIDPDDDSSSSEAELLRERAGRSAEHVFTLLSLILPRETLWLAFQGVHTDDRHLHGTALEYLETVLPEPVWVGLRPLLERGERQPSTSRRTAAQALKDLLASRASIEVALARQRRDGSA